MAQGTQKPQEVQETLLDPITPAQPDAQETDKEDIRQLMDMTLEDLEKLSEEKQRQIAKEFAEQVLSGLQIEGSLAETIMRAIGAQRQEMAQIGRHAAQVIVDAIPQLSQQFTDFYNSLVSEETRKALKETVKEIEAFQATYLIHGDLKEALRLLKILNPYLDEEMKAHPELYEWEAGSKTPGYVLFAAAARRAREDGKDIPQIKAEQWLQAELQGEVSETDKDEDPQRQAKRSAAEATGALMTIGQRLLVPSDPQYQNAFASRLNSDIGVFIIDRLTDLELRDNGLQLSFLDNGISDLVAANKKTSARPLKDADTGFLRAMAKAAYRTRIYSDSMVTRFYLPAFCDELGITGEHGKTTGGRAAAREREVLGKIEAMDNVWGKLPGKDQWWKVFSILGLDRDTEIVTVAMPYFNQLLAAMERKRRQELEAGKKYYIGFCDLLHASAANERNQAAVELAARVLIGVQQRGGTPDKRLRKSKNKSIKDETLCTWHISCAGLIEACPQMQEKLEAQKTTGGRNKAMQRAFSTMYRVLKEKSDLFTYYSDLSITEITPTTKTLDTEIFVRHHGLNPYYQRPVVIDEAQTESTEAV